MKFFKSIISYQNMKYNLFLLLSLLLVNVSFQNSVQCDGETIDKCTACNTGENSDSCSACEDKTFLFFHNLVCLPCNDSLYGQPGCGGKCNGTNFTEYGRISCEEGGCIEGYYRSYIGICRLCNSSYPHCSKCSYYQNEGFKCLECESDEYIIDQYGRCNNCTMNNCKKCKFDDDRTKTICEQCEDGFNINKKGECDKCYNETDYSDRICYGCDDDYEPTQCWCLEGYYENPERPNIDCLRCPVGCQDCTLNKETNKTECKKCEEKYTLDSKKECIECPFNCDTCEIDENGETKCLSCEIGYSFNKDKTCQSCSGGCANCELDEYDYPTTCLGCIEGYVLTPQNSCLACSSFSSVGGMEGFAQCSACIRNEEIKDYEDYICTHCNPGYAIYQGHVKNVKKDVILANSMKKEIICAQIVLLIIL